MSDSYIKVSLSDSLLQGYGIGATFGLYAEYPNGNYSGSSLTVSSSSVTEAFPSSASHDGYFWTGTVSRSKEYEDYKFYNAHGTTYKNNVAQNITTNDRNWHITSSSSNATRDTVTSGSGNDVIRYVDVVCAGVGNDSITIKGGSVRGGAGDDIIYCESSYLTNEENIVVFEANGGNDLVWGEVEKIQWENGFTGLSIGQMRYSSYYDRENKYYLGFHCNDDAIFFENNDEFVKIVDSNDTEIARVYLESDHKAGSLIDGSGYSTLELLVGNRYNDTIKAGRGGSSLWGGVGSDDSLVGGAGTDYFFYGDNDGIDYVMNSNAADRVVLYGSLSFQSISQTGNDLVIQYAPDRKLTVQNWSENGMNSFQIFDGSVWGIHFENGNPTYYRKG